MTYYHGAKSDPYKHPAMRPVAHPNAIHHRIQTSIISRPARQLDISNGNSSSKYYTKTTESKCTSNERYDINSLREELAQLKTQIHDLKVENQELKQRIDNTLCNNTSTRPQPMPSAPPMYDPRWLNESPNVNNAILPVPSTSIQHTDFDGKK